MARLPEWSDIIAEKNRRIAELERELEETRRMKLVLNRIASKALEEKP